MALLVLVGWRSAECRRGETIQEGSKIFIQLFIYLFSLILFRFPTTIYPSSKRVTSTMPWKNQFVVLGDVFVGGLPCLGEAYGLPM